MLYFVVVFIVFYCILCMYVTSLQCKFPFGPLLVNK